MSNARTNNPFANAPAADDDFDSSFAGDVLTSKMEAFAAAWARTGNKAAAYREAYNVHPHTLPNSVWKNANRVASLAKVQRRYDELMRQASLETIVTIRELLQLEWDIATADPNEIAYIAKRACRYCYGINHRYQWVDTEEHFEACVKALDEGKKPPSDAGGVGYTRGLEPADDCPHCLGLGIEETVLNDTRKLTGKARRLYAGLDYKNGQWVVKLHDQIKAREQVGRMLGAFKDALDLRTPAEKTQGSKIPDGLSEQEAARAYLGMLG